MKRLFLFLSIISLVACTNDIEDSASPHEVSQITMTVKDFKLDNKDTRMSVDVSPLGATFKWSENDTVGIFPNEGGQSYFPMIKGAGTNQAYFTGGGWALKISNTYMAYYPYNRYNFEKDKIAITYEGQTQVGNSNTNHLGQYDYMTAKATTPDNGRVNFDFKHLGCLVELNLTIPKAGSYQSVSLNCNEPVFTTKGIWALGSQSMLDQHFSNKYVVNLKNVTTAKPNEVIKVYMMMAPTNLQGKSIEVKVGDNIINFEGKNMIAGRLYSYALTFNDETGQDELWVDLDLPSGKLWASHNIGASAPEDYGDYFSWGEIAPKEDYSTDNYTANEITLDDISGNPLYDAARAIWGGNARIPNDSEFHELKKECTWTWTTQNGVSGRLVKSKKNDNSIFLPAAGYRNMANFSNVGKLGYYWSSIFNKNNAYNLCFDDKGYINMQSTARFRGLPIRPIRNK